MANVKVAIRVRPLSARESGDGGRLAVQVEDKFVKVRNVKLDGRTDGAVDSREKLLEFSFDYCYWSVDPADPHYASQEEVFQDLGVSVLAGASEGYNVCLFAYGQTGSGKTYTMMGTPDSVGLTPRICEGIFRSEGAFPDQHNPTRVEISFLEIYNERVRDLLTSGEREKRASLRVREHPEKGPYVQDLSQHVVSDCKQAMELLEEGITHRITAATHNHDASSRSHAIFTIQYTQAILENNLPSEIVSKINLVDLAGSERADPHYCRDRLTEGSNINKSLVTLGIVISALAQNSQMSSSCQSINSMASEGDGSTGGSHSSSLSGGGGGAGGRRHCFIPYRDSVLTWLLKDSLGGNSKTIMIATVSPSVNSYNETLSTLRYAAHAKNIVNKPCVNEDANVRLIRELREEIDRLKTMLLSFELQRHPSPSLSDEREGNLSDIVLQNELKVEQLTKDWSESWRDKRELLEQYGVDINRDRAGFLVNSLQPHLVTMDQDVLSTGVIFYHLREGITHIGPQDQLGEPQIVLQGSARCEIENQGGLVTLRPLPGCVCLLNDREVTEPCRLAQGTVITLGAAHKFRFNHPAEAAVLRERRRASEGAMTCNYADLCPVTSDSRKVELHPGPCLSQSEDPNVRQRVEQQQRYVECIRKEIQVEQRRTERELEREQANLRQQHKEIQQWIFQEKQLLATAEQRETQEFGVQADLLPAPLLERLTSPAPAQEGQTVDRPSFIVRVRKKLVQEELLKHHAVCRAESRIHRKRLQYQLERIARKRHLLEAKRELQRLEKALPKGLESPESLEQESPARLAGQLLVSRRHSFSADLRSRLYQRHAPILRDFLKRNRSAELTQNSPLTSDLISCRKWVSDECLPRARALSCSGGVLPGQSQVCSSGSALSSSKGSRPPAKEKPQTQFSREPQERKSPLPKLDLSFKNIHNPPELAKVPHRDTMQVDRKENIAVLQADAPSHHSVFSVSTPLHAGNKRLLSTKRTLSRRVGPSLKSALFKVLRKPTSHAGVGRACKPLGRMGKLLRRHKRDRGPKDGKTDESKYALTKAISFKELDQCKLSKGVALRRWHSTEALMNNTCRWVERQQALLRLEENEDSRDEEASDCESLFSLDSLSSAYATALAEQLRYEERAPSEAESEDSQISKDSLAVVSTGQHPTAARFSQTLVPVYTLVRDTFSPSLLRDKMSGIKSVWEHGTCQKSQVLPSEANWSQHGTIKAPSIGKSKIIDKPPSYTTLMAEPIAKDAACKVTQSENVVMMSSPRSLSSGSVREPESSLALTDAWSSADAAESPRLEGDAPTLQATANTGPLDSQSGSRASTCSSNEPLTVTMLEQSTSNVSKGRLDALDPEIQTAPDETCVRPEGQVADDCVQFCDGFEGLMRESVDTPACSYTIANRGLDLLSREIQKTTEVSSVPVAATEGPDKHNEMFKEMCDTSSSNSFAENEELCKMTLDSSRLEGLTKNEMGASTDVSPSWDKTLQEVETKATEQYLALQQDLVNSACKNSRKRNKDLQDSFLISLKLPKRNSGEKLVTLCSTLHNPGSQEVVWSHGNNNSSNYKMEGSERTERPNFANTNGSIEQNNNVACEEFHEKSKFTVKKDCMCHPKNISVDETEPNQNSNQIKVPKGHSHISNCRKYQEKRTSLSMSNVIVDSIDFRISEVVREHMTLSQTDNVAKWCLSQSLNSLTLDNNAKVPPTLHFISSDGREGEDSPLRNESNIQENWLISSEYATVENKRSEITAEKSQRHGYHAEIESASNPQDITFDFNAMTQNAGSMKIPLSECFDHRNCYSAHSDPYLTLSNREERPACLPTESDYAVFVSQGDCADSGDLSELKSKQDAVAEVNPAKSCKELNKLECYSHMPALDPQCRLLHHTHTATLTSTTENAGNNVGVDAKSNLKAKDCCSYQCRPQKTSDHAESGPHISVKSVTCLNQSKTLEHNNLKCSTGENVAMKNFQSDESDAPVKNVSMKQDNFTTPQIQSKGYDQTCVLRKCPNILNLGRRADGQDHNGANRDKTPTHQAKAQAPTLSKEIKFVVRSNRPVQSSRKGANRNGAPCVNNSSVSKDEKILKLAGTQAKKGRPKRFRRSRSHDCCLPSSSDSSLKSSDEEEDLRARVGHSHPLFGRVEPGTQTKDKSEDRQRGAKNICIPPVISPGQPDSDSTPTAPLDQDDGQVRTSRGYSQTIHHFIHQAMPQKNLGENVVSFANKVQNIQISRAMHFASSDINPFIHQWQNSDPNQQCCKSPAFSSAADLSCKSQVLSCTESPIVRCCSVDNGLNGQNCPFNSHLSIYANDKRLSSTLSSMDDYKENAATADDVLCQQMPINPHHHVANLSSNSSSNGAFGNNSGQVDEIVLVYSSEQESLGGRAQPLRTEHGTQTEHGLNAVVAQSSGSAAVLNRVERRKGSKNHVPSTQTQNANIKKSHTWASLDSMSAHLSKLIDSTSDLLEDVQGMRTGEVVKSSPTRNFSPSYVRDASITCADGPKCDSSTQTAVDVGIQTENPSAAAETKVDAYDGAPRGAFRPHEVNVIVKVIGSEVINISQDEDVHCMIKAKAKPDKNLHNSADVGVNTPTAPEMSASEPLTVGCQRNVRSACSRSLKTCVPEAPQPRSVTAPESPSRSFTNSCQGNRNSTVASIPSSHLKRIYTDRASSPILTVGASGCSKQKTKQPSWYPTNHRETTQDCVSENTSCGTSAVSLCKQRDAEDDQIPAQNSSVSSRESREGTWPERMSEMSCLSPAVFDKNTTCLGSPRNNCTHIDRRSICQDEESPKAESKCQKMSMQSSHCRQCSCCASAMHSDSFAAVRRLDPCKAQVKAEYRDNHSYIPGHVGCQASVTADLNERLNGAYSPLAISERGLKKDDVGSLSPSECNTDALVNAVPVARLSPIQGLQKPPEDLPLHNKFTNWSGISHHHTQRRRPSHKSAACSTNCHDRTDTAAEWCEQESCGSNVESVALNDKRAREIERLRQERESVMATVSLALNPTPLSVELTEAKIHYSLGETDTLLKMLSSCSSGESERRGTVPTKQQLYERHRRSIDGLKQEREERLQTCRRARSLSPGKHPQSPPQPPSTSSRVSATMSGQRELTDSSREQDPLRGSGLCPSDIEHLLRDYGRAREEARTEIAKARERLRERMEQEKRRLQRQAQGVKDDLKCRTRVSNSTLCTGSSHSLSSGPTSGYNSGNMSQLQNDNTLSPPGKTTGFPGKVPKVRTCPSPLQCGNQSVKAQGAWMAAQDVHPDPPAIAFEPLMTSSPSPPACNPRHRTTSSGSSSSVSMKHQDVTSSLLGRALAEVRLACSGDFNNLVLGKPTAGWRYYGTERGIQAYYKPSSSPSVHAFLGAGELDIPLLSLWNLLCQPSKSHMYHQSLRSVWTRPLDDSTQLVYLLTDSSSCHLSQPRDFCCISTESRQGGLYVLAMQSVFEESLPRPSVNAVRGEIMPSCWVLQPITRGQQEVTRVIYLLQVDLGMPSFPQRLLNTIVRRQAAVIADLGDFLAS